MCSGSSVFIVILVAVLQQPVEHSMLATDRLEQWSRPPIGVDLRQDANPIIGYYDETGIFRSK